MSHSPDFPATAIEGDEKEQQQQKKAETKNNPQTEVEQEGFFSLCT